MTGDSVDLAVDKIVGDSVDAEPFDSVVSGSVDVIIIGFSVDSVVGCPDDGCRSVEVIFCDSVDGAVDDSFGEFDNIVDDSKNSVVGCSVDMDCSVEDVSVDVIAKSVSVVGFSVDSVDGCPDDEVGDNSFDVVVSCSVVTVVCDSVDCVVDDSIGEVVNVVDESIIGFSVDIGCIFGDVAGDSVDVVGNSNVVVGCSVETIVVDCVLGGWEDVIVVVFSIDSVAGDTVVFVAVGCSDVVVRADSVDNTNSSPSVNVVDGCSDDDDEVVSVDDAS